MKLTTLLSMVTLLTFAAGPAAAHEWTITPIAGAPPEQIRVQVTAALSSPNPCTSYAYCSQSHMTGITITPCPVGETCSIGLFMRYYPMLPSAVSATFDLRCGVQYTFSGSINSHFTLPDLFYGCGHAYSCNWGSPMDLTTFYWGATPVQPLSFGRLKMLYR